ncbi:MAG: cupredoxin domain-containing protein [Flavobacteriales bacterium]|nr:cupredoxin domain-containing protein [Flavobacteriales bacterium]
MKKNILGLLFIFMLGGFINTLAAQTNTVHLEQTEGEFTIQSLTLEEGTYVFEIENNGVDHEVGFVLAPKGMTDEAHHIKEAYVKETVKEGKTSMTSEVTLKKGEYVYFCPLNPTPQYTLIVK